MEKNCTSPNSDGMCKKIYKAITVCSFCHRPKDHGPAIAAAPNPSLPIPYPASNALNAQHLKTPENIKVAEVIPITYDPPTHASIQKNSQVEKVAPKIEPVPHIASVKDDKTKPKAEAAELAPPHVSVPEKPKPKAEMAPPTKVVVGQSHDQGANVTWKVESTTPHVSVQEEQSKPKVETASRSKAVAGQGQQHVVKKDEPPRVNEKEHQTLRQDTINNKSSAYIDRAKVMIRTTTNAGGGKTAMGLNNIDDNASDYIKRAKMKIKSMASFGGGKSVSSK